MQGQIGFEDNQERAPTEKGSTFWFTAMFMVNEEDEYVEHPQFSDMQVVSVFGTSCNGQYSASLLKTMPGSTSNRVQFRLVQSPQQTASRCGKHMVDC